MAAKQKKGGAGLLVTVDQQILNKALSAISGALPRKNEIPILDTVLMETCELGLRFTVTNLVQEATVEIEAKVDGEGATCVDARALLAIVGRLKGELIVEQGEKELLVVGTRGRTGLPMLPAMDFQRFGEIDGVELEVAQGSLSSGLGLVQHAIANDEARYYLNGVFIEHADGELIFTATDGHRLATIKVTAGAVEPFEAAILPRNAIGDIIKLCDRAGEPVKFTISDRMIEVASRGEQYRTKLVEGAYPDWRRVYPKTDGIKICAPRKELMDALGVAISASREKSSAVKLTATEGRLTLTTRSDGGPWAEGLVEWTDIPPCEPFGVNGKYLMQALEKLSANEVELIVTDAASPIRVVADDTLRQVIMPLRV